MSYRIGIDVGGTFTDFVLVRRDGSIRVSKSPTTPQDQAIGILGGIEELAGGEHLTLGELLSDTAAIIHGTTTADNTLIEMSGAVTGLITTRGHRDEIELRRGYKENIWDPALPPPPPIALRRRRLGVPERLDYTGSVVVPLDEEAVRLALRRLVKLGTQSLAVVFMFSFINPAHERRVREIAAEECPGLSLSLSHEVLPAAPEFERTSTTLVNAYVGPKIGRYLGVLAERLRAAGYEHELLIMQSNGGIMTPEYIVRRPVTVLSSGPTGGVIAACAVAAKSLPAAARRSDSTRPPEASGVRKGSAPAKNKPAAGADFVCADMGGTSYDVCLIRGGRPEVKAGWNWHHRYLVGLPMVDVQSIGAGGGSLAEVIAGVLHVGPRSAGAEPGPICYGRGGSVPTVTDANLTLGYLNPDGFCNGTMQLRSDAARQAITAQIGRPLGLDTAPAAHGIYRLVNAKMADAIRRISAQRGVDPRGLTMVVYGGNGPVHATAQAEELGIQTVLVPKTSPAFSALGLLLSDHLVDETRAYITPVGRADPGRITMLFADMERAARAVLGVRAGRSGTEIRRFAHLCYPGQTFDIAVPLDGGRQRLDARGLRALVERFHELHEELHTYASRDEEPILRSVRLSAIGKTEKPELPTYRRSSARPPTKGRRQAFFAGRFVSTPIYDGPGMRAGQRVRGPAIIEEPFTTIVLHPGQVAALDGHGNYKIAVPTR